MRDVIQLTRLPNNTEPALLGRVTMACSFRRTFIADRARNHWPVADRELDRLAELHEPLRRQGQRPEKPQHREEGRDRQVRHAKDLANRFRTPDQRIDLFGAHDRDRDDGDVEREREPREARAEGAQPVAVAERLRDARDALGEDDHLLAALEQHERVLARGHDAADPAIERVDRRDVRDEAVVEEARDPSVVHRQRGADHRAVERQRTRVVGDEERGPRPRQVVQPERFDAPVALVEELEDGRDALAELEIESERIVVVWPARTVRGPCRVRHDTRDLRHTAAAPTHHYHSPQPL